LFRDADSRVGGNPNGDITLVEFFDYNCPYCRQMVPVMMQAEASDPQLRVVYKEFPILGPNSTFAAKAALAAHKQGKYVAFHRALYQVRGAVDPSKVTEVAVAVGLDADRLKADMGNPTIGALIEKNLALARALRIDGTPGFVTGNQVLRGAVQSRWSNPATSCGRSHGPHGCRDDHRTPLNIFLLAARRLPDAVGDRVNVQMQAQQ
jgi:protein-disulfide isomerase